MIPARLVRSIDQKNVIAMAFAAGNSNQDCGGASSILCINSNEGGITAAALDRNGNPQAYSSRGPGQCSLLHPFIGAPTFGVLPYGAGYVDMGEVGGGTSSATPQLSGALAILKGEIPKANNTLLRTALAAGARKTNFPSGFLPFAPATGFGMLQVDRALDWLPSARVHPFYPVISSRFAAPLRVPATRVIAGVEPSRRA
jgi:subtilisin family serine protease